MFIDRPTVPCDSHKRLEKSTFPLPPLLCTLPAPPSPPPPPCLLQSLKAQLKKNKGWEEKKKIKFVVNAAGLLCSQSALAQIPIRQTHSGVKVQQRVTKSSCVRVESERACERETRRKRFLATPHQGGAQFVCYFCFLKLQK